MTAFVTENKEWDCWLSELSFAYNSSIHTTTGFSESMENDIENIDCTEQGYSSESDDDNHNDNENADNIVNDYRARLRPRPVIPPDYIYY